MLLVVFIAAFVLWGASGRIARRIARPLDELTEVVKRIGGGDYSARSQVGCYEPDEIGVVSEAVNDMAAKIQKQVSDQRELLAAVSHELRTPLARVRIISELGRDNGPIAKTWDDIDREVVEMDALVGELLASSRLEFEALALRELDLKDTALRAVERAGLKPEQLKLDSQLKTLKADPTLLARALANLLENARKHAGGAEQLVVRDEPGALVFEVDDRGPGLPQGGEGELFEAFTKGTATRGEGLGLGLALVKRIAVAHKGSAFAKNREGGGATVGVRLPV
jgi:signal transduction histidine kinase